MASSALKLTPPQPRKRRGKGRRRSPAERIAEFSIPEALARADAILAGPCQGHLPRVEGRGELVQRFVLPLELVRRRNEQGLQKQWALAALKDKVFRCMWVQVGGHIRSKPLPGRPHVICVRFSSVEPDAFSDSFKMCVDCLCAPKPPRKPGGRKKLGLGFLIDDAPRYIDRSEWWERVRPGEGFGMVAVYAGDGGTNASRS